MTRENHFFAAFVLLFLCFVFLLACLHLFQTSRMFWVFVLCLLWFLNTVLCCVCMCVLCYSYNSHHLFKIVREAAQNSELYTYTYLLMNSWMNLEGSVATGFYVHFKLSVLWWVFILRSHWNFCCLCFDFKRNHFSGVYIKVICLQPIATFLLYNTTQHPK